MTKLAPPTAASGTMARVLTIAEGGTGAATAAAALANLQGIDRTTINLPNGPMALGSDGKMTFSLTNMQVGIDPTIDGPPTVHKDTTNLFTITNYHASTDYVVTTTNGTISRYRDSIAFNPTEVGNSGFLVNGKMVSVVVAASRPAVPLINVPVNRANNVGQRPQIGCSGFVPVAAGDTYLNADWQLSLSPTFDTILVEGLAKTENGWWFPGDLTAGTTYYVRVRHRGTLGAVSNWSLTGEFRTMDIFVATASYGGIGLTSGNVTGDQFARCVSMSLDGLHLAVGVMGRNNNVGAMAVYTRSAATTSSPWTQSLYTELATAGNALARFGFRVKITPDGTRIFVGAPTRETGNGNGSQGTVYTYLRTGANWAYENTILAPAANTYGWFGSALGCDATGTRLIVGSLADNAPSYPLSGRSYIYLRTGSNYALERQINAEELYSDGLFGTAVAMSAGGDRVVITLPWRNYVQPARQSGAAFVYTRSGTTWTLHTKLLPPLRGPNENFGCAVAANSDLSVIAVGNHYLGYFPADDLTPGCVDIFILSGNAYVHETRITPNDGLPGDFFGNWLELSQGGTRLFVGAPLATKNGLKTGNVYVYTSNAGAWSQTAMINQYSYQTDGLFGDAIGINSTGSQAAVGARGMDNMVPNQGVVFVCN